MKRKAAGASDSTTRLGPKPSQSLDTSKKRLKISNNTLKITSDAESLTKSKPTLASKSAPKSAPKSTPQPGSKSKFQKDSDHNSTDASHLREAKTQSTLSIEERSFPRGGASVLTPLEHKQIHNEAVRDVLFDQPGVKRNHIADISQEDEDGDGLGSTLRTVPRKPFKKRPKKNDATEYSPSDNTKIQIQGLTFKRLAPGTILLGTISLITDRDIAVALPNNLTGYVPLTAISDTFNQRISHLADQADAADTADDQSQDDDSQHVSLKKMFRIGQIIRAVVTTITTKDHSHKKNHIELSLNPKLTNPGLIVQDLVPGTIIQASVQSIEDHGLVMHIDLPDAQATGFLSAKDLAGLSHTDIEQGSVFLCMISKASPDGRLINLTLQSEKMGNVKKNFINSTASVKALLPGAAVELLISDVEHYGVIGKLMGSLDATIDMLHLGSKYQQALQDQLSVGSKLKARVVFRYPDDENRPVGLSILPNLIQFKTIIDEEQFKSINSRLSAVVEQATVQYAIPKQGIFLDIGGPIQAFAHVSMLSQDMITNLSADQGKYRVGTKHTARIISYSLTDNLYLLSLQQEVIDRQFLRVEDVPIGQVIQGSVDRIVLSDHGIAGVIININDGISGFVPAIHLADTQLSHPERKFKQGLTVKARVLSIDLNRRTVRLTMKKTLVNSNLDPWTCYEQIKPGDKSPGTLVNVFEHGAVVQFYGHVKAYLPISQVSEAYIKDVRHHFKAGQVVSVRVLDVDPANARMTVSCKDPCQFLPEHHEAFHKHQPGDLITAVISEITKDMLTLHADGLKARLPSTHLTDGPPENCHSLRKKMKVGQTLTDLLIIRKIDKDLVLVLSKKPSLSKASKQGDFPVKFDDMVVGKQVTGFARHINKTDIFVEFGAGLVALLPSLQIDSKRREQPQFGYAKEESVTAWVLNVNVDKHQVCLSTKTGPQQTTLISRSNSYQDTSIELRDDKEPTSNLSLGMRTTVKIIGIKPTQLNVKLSDGLHARLDASEVFHDWSQIKDWKNPLCTYKKNQEISVRLIGLHDVKTSRFLPFSHRRSNTVFEMAARPSPIDDDSYVLTMEKVRQGETYIGIVQKHDDGFLMVKLSPSVIGRLPYICLSGKPSDLQHPLKGYPLGAAIRVVATTINIHDKRLDLTTCAATKQPEQFSSVEMHAILTGRVTKITNDSVTIHLGGSVSGIVGLTELSDDYAQARTTAYSRNDIVKVKVVGLDEQNKKIHLSLRLSLTSGHKLVQDRFIGSLDDLKVNDVVRGFIKNIADQGVFISLAPKVTAIVRIPNLSDGYIKDWKEQFTVNELVTGRILDCDASSGRIQMSLKPSVLGKDFLPPLSFEQLEQGQIYTGKVRKVESFGVFIALDNSNNVSGLCHRSEIADGHVADVTKLYEVGDPVKTIILKADKDKRRVSFGLKASYFQDGSDDSDQVSVDLEEHQDGVIHQESSDEQLEESEGRPEGEPEQISINLDKPAQIMPTKGLVTAGFDWSGGLQVEATIHVSSDEELAARKKQKKKKPSIQVDQTGELDKYGPQAKADFERLLLGKPNSSSIWIQYMAFQLGQGEVDEARVVADRALKTINMREENEKLNVWIALLNLENTYGSDESLDDVFKNACACSDKQEMHERLVSILVESGKHNRAEHLFQNMALMKDITVTIPFWINYATFLLTTLDNPTAARALLLRATQSVPVNSHCLLAAKFGALEFTSPHGDKERGRTIFEGLLSNWPKRTELWDMYVDLERAHSSGEAANKANVRHLFERMAKVKMGKRRARFVFKRWLEFEQVEKNEEGAELVKRLASEFVAQMHQDDDDPKR